VSFRSRRSHAIGPVRANGAASTLNTGCPFLSFPASRTWTAKKPRHQSVPTVDLTSSVADRSMTEEVGRGRSRPDYPHPDPAAAPRRPKADHDAGGRGGAGTEAAPRRQIDQGARPRAPLAADNRERSGESLTDLACQRDKPRNGFASEVARDIERAAELLRDLIVHPPERHFAP
jgi:hypothetical protein